MLAKTTRPPARRGRIPFRRAGGHENGRSYLAVSVAASPFFLRLSQLYLRWNFSTRPVVSTYFILPVKKGWQAEQISTVMFFLVLRVTNLLPHPQVTVASTYSGWMPDFMDVLHCSTNRYIIVEMSSVHRQGQIRRAGASAPHSGNNARRSKWSSCKRR